MIKQPTSFTRSKKVQQKARMKPISMQSSHFPALFGHRFRLAHDLIAGCLGNRGSHFSSRRFSARFGHTCGCTNLRQNSRHDTAHLSRRHPVSTPFPGTIERESKDASQRELVHSGRYYQAPALKLLRSTHMHLRPEQILFEKAIAVLMGEPEPIGSCDFRKIK